MPSPSPEIADRILIARLSLDPEGDMMSDDSEKLTVLSNLPKGQTSFDYLTGAWKRCRAQQLSLRKALTDDDAAQAQSALDEIRGLIVSYLGLVIITPDMFANASKPSTSQLRHHLVSPLSLVPSLLRQGGGSQASSSDPYASDAPSAVGITEGDPNRWASFAPHELPDILTELAKRFDGEGLDEILGPALTEIARQILQGPDDGTISSKSQPSNSNSAANGNNEAMNAAAAAGDVRAVLAHLLGQAQGGSTNATGAGGSGGPGTGTSSNGHGIHLGSLEWTTYVNAFRDCTDIKPIAAMMTKLANFNPTNVAAPVFERQSLFGPVLRLSSFADSSPAICRDFFADPSARATIFASQSTLRSSLSTVHNLHFNMFNNLIRSSGSESREAALAYWGTACELNRKRGAMQVRAKEVATDSFMVNLFETVMRFCEPFMDLRYSKVREESCCCTGLGG